MAREIDVKFCRLLNIVVSLIFRYLSKIRGALSKNKVPFKLLFLSLQRWRG